jgi:predicted PhzF superfamily epimerase YddE/YHI9
MNPAKNQNPVYLDHTGSHQLMASFIPHTADLDDPRDRGGNPCLLSILENAPENLPPPTPKVTHCQSWPTRHNGQAMIAVACYTASGQSIRCCGHGLLAAAHSWLERLQCAELSLLMGGSVVHSWREQAVTWLRFKRLSITPLPVPEWAEEVFPEQQPAITAAISDDEHGYLVMQWPDDFNLKQLEPLVQCLSANSRRALICTSAHPSMGEDVIQLRYFAPQYGVDEDPATGSAVRVLADYWSQRFVSLTARQCSPSGGLLLARLTPGHVEVGGHCQAVERSNNA